jgi:hypothetical protein
MAWSRGGVWAKFVKRTPGRSPAPSPTNGFLSTATMPAPPNPSSGASISKPTVFSRNLSDSTPASSTPKLPEFLPMTDETLNIQRRNPEICVDSTHAFTHEGDDEHGTMLNDLLDEIERPDQTNSRRDLSLQCIEEGEEDASYEAVLDTLSIFSIEDGDTYGAVLDTLSIYSFEEAQSSASSADSRGISSAWSGNSSTTYSTVSSPYSSDTSASSSREGNVGVNVDDCLPGGMRLQQRTGRVAVTQREAQDAMARKRSSLAKKAALFMISRVPPPQPLSSRSLPRSPLAYRTA